MSIFSELWDNQVKELIESCITEPELVCLICVSESYVFNENEKEYLKEVVNKCKDPYGRFYVSDMIYKVEHALADRRKAMAGIAIMQVYNNINSDTYLKNVFNGDDENDEYKRTILLRDEFGKLIKVCV